MSVEEEEAIAVNIAQWVEKARHDPPTYLERQATEVFLTAIGMAEPYCRKVFLKGGVLMGVVYNSIRQTGDIDFTTTLEPDPDVAERLREALEAVFPRVTAELGYPDLLCQVQSVRYFPSPQKFPKADGPAVKIKIGYARRGSPQHAWFEKGQASDVLEADISFREPVGAIQIVRLSEEGGSIRTYSLHDLIAEKLRALLQQDVRNRYRRQDIYDIDLLIDRFSFDDEEKAGLHALLVEKCRARNIDPGRHSLAEPEVIRRARAEWESLALEIGEVPDFDECFARVNDFYRTLPWES